MSTERWVIVVELFVDGGVERRERSTRLLTRRSGACSTASCPPSGIPIS